ncbi:lipopolysaccharide biosynthesis protein [Methylobacterium sp. Leaf85]|uniref:lipopolysaccharide biosynthesis protein n=1 Tax=Methylobacterium sp. Leaf85 TaxID=1736241 RepID=UPI0007002069|nr:polysaccharide biosynthesis C-terminal domain-containing protein [Methylobacterium sp. Leaf85]KQO51711.1 teichoic acid transporter [Methylobacterium sp. Leaf85]
MAVIAAFILNAGLNFCLGLLLAKLMGPADFGLFGLATTGAVVLNTLVFEWLRLSATRFYSNRVRQEEPWIRHGLDRAYAVLALVLLVASALCAVVGATVEMDVQGRFAIAAGAGLAAFGIGLFDYHAALTRARFDGGLYLKLTIVKNGLAFLLMAGAAWLFPQPVWVLVACGLSQFLPVLVLRRPLLDPKVPIVRVRMGETWRLFRAYGLPLIAANAIYQITPFLNRSAIAMWFGLAEAGYFALAADVATRSLSMIGTALDLILFQLAVRVDEHEGHVAAEAQIGRNAGIVVALMVPCAGGLWAVLPAIQGLIVPEAYRGPFALYALILIPGLLCGTLLNFGLNPIFQIRRKTVPVIAAAIVGLAVNAVCLIVLPTHFGAPGIAMAQSAGLVASTLWLAVRALAGPQRLRIDWWDVFAACTATLAMMACLAPFRHMDPAMALAISLPLGVLVYVLLVALFDIAGLRSLAAAYLRQRTVTPTA